MIKHKKILFCFIALIFVLPITASALEVPLPGLPPSPTVTEYAAYFFNIGIGIAVSLALLAIAIGGTYYLLSFSRGKFTGEGKEWVRAGITGLIILLCAYLIAYTINPDLLSFRLPGLPPIRLFGININVGNSEPITEVYYQEIPIGTLTETLLSKTMFCYDFDSEGNPIPLELKTDNNKKVGGPTYKNRDRVDCFLKLSEAIEKKSNEINELSKKINELMQQCSCSNGSCETNWNPQCPSKPPCIGKGTCAPIQGKSCCPAEAKEKIEHGPIKIDCLTSTPDNINIEPVFPLPNSDDTSIPCQVKSIGGIIKKTKNIVIGSDIDRAAVQWAVDQWNKLTPYKVFGNITVSDSAVNSYCFYDIYGNCKGKPLPTNVQRIYNRPIDTKGTTSWQPPAYARWNINNGEVTQFDINLDLNSSFFDSKDKLKIVLLHELGHALGLDDAYDKKTGKSNPNCKDSIMNSNLVLKPGEAEKKAIESLYGMPVTTLYSPYSFVSYQKNQPTAINFGVAFSTNPDGACCSNTEKNYKGLDEFRTKVSSVSDAIEQKVQVDKKDIAIINIDGKQGVQTQKQWKDLRLIEQLMYLKEKVKEIESEVKNDIDKLDSARKEVANCYNVKSSVDFLKIKEGVKKEEKKVVVSKQWNDIDSSKYCKGFNYANSSCYKLCGDMCPDATQEVVKCYNKCAKDKCEPDDEDCFGKQQECIGECYNSRACPLQDPSNKKPAKNFTECISNCRQDCSDLCSKKYPTCSSEYKQCKQLCDNDSKCVLDNADACLFNTATINTIDFTNCITQEDPRNIKNCLKNSYLCKFGSDEYAGYPDCTTGITGCAPNTQNLKNKEYSSSYIFDNWDKQRCPNPYKTCQEGSNAGQTCLDLYSETTKCPSNSYCPSCPCGTNEVIDDNAEKTKDKETNEEVSHALVAGQCNEHIYNKDPLTFYCAVIFEQSKPITGELFDSTREKADEIPVGQAVDGAKKWAKDFLDIISKFTEKVDNMAKYIKGVGEEKNYCKCDSDCGSEEKACQAECKEKEVEDEEGNKSKTCEQKNCSGNPCQKMINLLLGKKPEDKGTEKDKCPKDPGGWQKDNEYDAKYDKYAEYYEKFQGMEWYYNKVRGLLEKVRDFILKDKRTDPLKELSYSRKRMDECSRALVLLDESNVKTISCTIAYPSTGFLQKRCYGILDGKVKTPAVDQTDNWFCYQKIIKTQ